MDRKQVTHLVTRSILPATGLIGLGLVLANLATVGVVMQRTYHAVRNTPRIGAIQINIYDGTRKKLPSDAEILVRVIDGNQKEVLVRYLKGGTIRVDNLTFHDNLGDRYTVIVWKDGYKQAGYYPVNLRRGETVSVDLMLVPKDYRLNFDAAGWERIKVTTPELHGMLTSGLTDQEARSRWERLLLERPLTAAHLLNVAAALATLPVATGEKILPFYKELVFDETLKQNNFFAWADKRMAAELRKSVAQSKTWEFAAGSQVFHPNNTGSFKELSFYEANVQITVYEETTKILDGVEVVRVETDIDYYRDPAAHIILEVIPNTVGNGITDPLTVYQLRFIASKAKFAPLYTVEER